MTARGPRVSVIERQEAVNDKLEMLEQARRFWLDRQSFRKARQTARDYYRGRQWDALITDPDNPDEQISEKALIERQGRIPFVMNHVQAVIRNLKGQFRQNRSSRAVFATQRVDDPDAIESLNVALKSTRRLNKQKMLEVDAFEEHLLSGASAFRTSIEYQPQLNRNEIRIDPVEQTRLFYNTDLSNRRLDGLTMIGVLHDFTMDELIAHFASDDEGNHDAQAAEELRQIYADQSRYGIMDRKKDFGRVDSLDFFTTVDPAMHRVIEIWREEYTLQRFVHDPVEGRFMVTDMTDEEVAEENERREILGLPHLRLKTRYEPVWHVYWLTPFGDELLTGPSPYWHEDHPFVLGLATLVDGESWGLIDAVIDPQRWLNRLTSMIDFSLSSSAKGLLLVPEEAIPTDLDINDFAAEWTKANGIIKIRARQGAQIPQQITGAAIPQGTFEILGAVKQWIEETSGVTGPQQGFTPKSGTPAALYQQQIMQAATTNLDYFESFMEMLRELDRKTLQLIMQGWNEQRILVEGSRGQPVVYDPDAVRSVDADVALGEVTDTATHRQLWEQDLQQFLGAGFIDFQTYLELSSHPKSEQLLKLIQRDPELQQFAQMDPTAMGAAMRGGAARSALTSTPQNPEPPTRA